MDIIIHQAETSRWLAPFSPYVMAMILNTRPLFFDPRKWMSYLYFLDINSLICANDLVECEEYGNTRTCHADCEQRNRPQVRLKFPVTQDTYTSKAPWVVAPNFAHLPDIYSFLEWGKPQIIHHDIFQRKPSVGGPHDLGSPHMEVS